jgi:hypothetical protein
MIAWRVSIRTGTRRGGFLGREEPCGPIALIEDSFPVDDAIFRDEEAWAKGREVNEYAIACTVC